MPLPILGILASLFGAGLSFVNSSISRKEQHNNLQMSLNAQKRENEKNREYNMTLAKQKNQWNLEQWERENAALKESIADERAYNDPSAQMARLQSAGLNPDMYYGNGSLVNTSSAYDVASSPPMTAGAYSNPMDWSSLAGRKTIGEAINESLQNRMMEAQIQKVKAETANTDASTSILESDAKFRDAYNQGLIETQNMSLSIGAADRDLKVVNTDKVRHEIIEIDNRAKLLNEQVSQVRATVSNLDADTAYKKVKTIIDQKLSDEQIRSMAAKRQVDYATAKKIVEELPAYIANLEANTANLGAHTENLGADTALKKTQNGLTFAQGVVATNQGELLRLQVETESNHPRHMGGVWTHVYRGMDFASDVVGLISPFLGAGPKTVHNVTNQYLKK